MSITESVIIILLKIVLEEARTGSEVEVLNWDKVNFDGIKCKLAQVEWERLFVGKGTSTSGRLKRRQHRQH